MVMTRSYKHDGINIRIFQRISYAVVSSYMPTHLNNRKIKGKEKYKTPAKCVWGQQYKNSFPISWKTFFTPLSPTSP